MAGTIINVITVIIGSSLGLGFGRLFPQRARDTIVAGLGLFTTAIGLKMFFETQNELIVLGGLLLGGLLGEYLKIESRLSGLGERLEKRFGGEGEGDEDADGRSTFVRGFLTASLVFCVGPMTILGALQDGLTGDYKLLAIKSVLDGFASFAFASTLGLGVIFAAPVVLLYQGGISLLAAQIKVLLTEAMIAEMTATGGVILVGLAISSLLEIKPIRVANFLPGLVVSPVIVALVRLVGGGS
ncbi:MAG: putative membrane protein YdfK [Chloroflexi bacterium]|nr:putative membrane protein YdfK [Chloroflexota bacterium]